jgi:hypothetical protein
MIKVRACKGVSQKWAWESHFMLPRVQESVREWISTLPSELSLWELESQWTPEFSKGNCRNQISFNWKVYYIIGKLFELRCLKWASMTHLGFLKHKLWQKKGWKSSWQFDSQPLKVGNCPNFFTCKWRTTYFWKDLDEGYNFA